MGGLIKDGVSFRYLADDFSRGLWDGLNAPPGYAQNIAGWQADSAREGTPGVLDGIRTDLAFNANTFGTGTDPCVFMYPYQRDDGASSNFLIVSRNAELFELTAAGPTTLTPAIGSTTTIRYGAQAMGYLFVGGGSITMWRYNQANPGGAGKLSIMGTKAPTNQPTMTTGAIGGAALTSGTGYKYRYAWEYGTGRELGMGWKGNITPITIAATGHGVTVTMDADPPTSWTHAVSRALFRNTTAYLNSYFLVTRTPYAGSSIATTYGDILADTAIEGGEETDPINAQDTTSPPFSELLPPACIFFATHEGRLWGLDVTSAGTRYSHRVVYSRISPAGPKACWDQFEPTAFCQAGDPSLGTATGLMSWMGNLYCFFEHGITVLSSDPGPGRLAAFSTVVAGRGNRSPQSLVATPIGIMCDSYEGPIIFDGSSNPRVIGVRISGQFFSSGSTSVAGYSNKRAEYAITTGSKAFIYNTTRDQWFGYSNTADTAMTKSFLQATYSCQHAGRHRYSATDGIVLSFKGSTERSIYPGTNQMISRILLTPHYDFGNPSTLKYLRRIHVNFADSFLATANATITAILYHPELNTVEIAKAFPSTSSRSFVFSYGPSSNEFTHMQVQMTFGITNTYTEDSIFKSFEIEGNYSESKRTVTSGA